MTVNIHGKQYVTVAERVADLHKARNGETVSIETGIASEDDSYVTMWAKVIVPAGTFWGHARSNKSDRSIEGQSPLEVAETSAIGRALGFAGFGIVEGIATADEVKAAQGTPRREPPPGKPEGAAGGTKKQDSPANAALRKLYATAKGKGMDEGGLKAFLQTDSLKALAEHMMGAKGDCDMGHPHDVSDYATAYRVMIRWVESS